MHVRALFSLFHHPAHHETAVRVYIEPTVILVSTKVDDAVIDKFDPDARGGTPELGFS